VQGPLSVQRLLASPTLADYASFLELSRISLPEGEAGGAGEGEAGRGMETERECDDGGDGLRVVDDPGGVRAGSGGGEGGEGGVLTAEGGVVASALRSAERSGAGRVAAQCGGGEGSGAEYGAGFGLTPEVERGLNALYLLAQGRGGQGAGLLVRALCEAGVPADGHVTRQKPGTAPLHVAAGGGHLCVVEALLECGAAVNLINPAHVTAVQLGASSSAEVLDVLLNAGSPV
jgi:hypothetical protein